MWRLPFVFRSKRLFHVTFHINFGGSIALFFRFLRMFKVLISNAKWCDNERWWFSSTIVRWFQRMTIRQRMIDDEYQIDFFLEIITPSFTIERPHFFPREFLNFGDKWTHEMNQSKRKKERKKEKMTLEHFKLEIEIELQSVIYRWNSNCAAQWEWNCDSFRSKWMKWM